MFGYTPEAASSGIILIPSCAIMLSLSPDADDHASKIQGTASGRNQQQDRRGHQVYQVSSRMQHTLMLSLLNPFRKHGSAPEEQKHARLYAVSEFKL